MAPKMQSNLIKQQKSMEKQIKAAYTYISARIVSDTVIAGAADQYSAG